MLFTNLNQQKHLKNRKSCDQLTEMTELTYCTYYVNKNEVVNRL